MMVVHRRFFNEEIKRVSMCAVEALHVLVLMTYDGNGRVMDLDTGAIVRTFAVPVPCVFELAMASGPVASTTFVVQRRGGVAEYDARTGSVVRFVLDAVQPECMSVTPDGSTIVVVTWETFFRHGVLQVYDYRTGRMAAQVRVGAAAHVVAKGNGDIWLWDKDVDLDGSQSKLSVYRVDSSKLRFAVERTEVVARWTTPPAVQRDDRRLYNINQFAPQMLAQACVMTNGIVIRDNMHIVVLRSLMLRMAWIAACVCRGID
jgi:hypothetical protein